jgi:tetratricopeptide (TPR) repeat protein
MKRITLVLLTLVAAAFGTKVSAQGKYGADSAECIKYLSYYQEYYKQKNYAEALPNWRKAFKLCPPTASQNMLLNGMTLIGKEIVKEKDPQVRASLIDTVLTLNDLRAQYYPKYAVAAYNSKGQYITQYFKDPQVVHEKLSEIIEINQEKTKPSLLLLNLNSAIELYKKSAVSAEDVINSYQNAIALLDKAEASEENTKIKSDIEGLFITSQVASCDNLIALFTPRYEADPDNMDLVTNIVKMLGSTDGCQNNELFLNAVTKLHKSEPSASSAYYLYKLYSSKDEATNAINYLEEAVSLCADSDPSKADYLIELATYSLKNNLTGKAFDYAKKAAELNPAHQGKAYYLIATIWGSARCGGNEIESRAKYWVAVDYLQKAKSADASLADDCNKLISSYSIYYPQKAEAFMYDVVDGQSYNVNCGGMHATTTVRTQK